MTNWGDDARDDNLDDVRFSDIAPALEFMCWMVLLLAPFLHWINGPPVSRDQAVIQVSLVALAALAAFSLRVYNYVTQRRK